MHWFQRDSNLGTAMLLIINCAYKIKGPFAALNPTQCKAILDHVRLLERRVEELNKKVATYKEMEEDQRKALKMLDDAGVWTGFDSVVHDRVYQVIEERDFWKKQAGAK